jgi:uridine kinase
MIIGIGGVSRAGKTTLAYKIREWLHSQKVFIIHQDEYIQPEDSIPKIKNHIDWEHPKSLDFKKLKEIISEKKNEYQLILVEGLMVFNDDELLNMMDKKIYIEISKEAFLNRKTLDNRWGDEPDWYIEHIWDSHFLYGLLPGDQKNAIKVDGEGCCIDDQIQDFLNIPKTNDYDN